MRPDRSPRSGAWDASRRSYSGHRGRPNVGHQRSYGGMRSPSGGRRRQMSRHASHYTQADMRSSGSDFDSFSDTGPHGRHGPRSPRSGAATPRHGPARRGRSAGADSYYAASGVDSSLGSRVTDASQYPPGHFERVAMPPGGHWDPYAHPQHPHVHLAPRQGAPGRARVGRNTPYGDATVVHNYSTGRASSPMSPTPQQQRSGRSTFASSPRAAPSTPRGGGGGYRSHPSAVRPHQSRASTGGGGTFVVHPRGRGDDASDAWDDDITEHSGATPPSQQQRSPPPPSSPFARMASRPSALGTTAPAAKGGGGTPRPTPRHHESRTPRAALDARGTPRHDGEPSGDPAAYRSYYSDLPPPRVGDAPHGASHPSNPHTSRRMDVAYGEDVGDSLASEEIDDPLTAPPSRPRGLGGRRAPWREDPDLKFLRRVQETGMLDAVAERNPHDRPLRGAGVFSLSPRERNDTTIRNRDVWDVAETTLRPSFADDDASDADAWNGYNDISPTRGLRSPLSPRPTFQDDEESLPDVYPGTDRVVDRAGRRRKQFGPPTSTYRAQRSPARGEHGPLAAQQGQRGAGGAAHDLLSHVDDMRSHAGASRPPGQPLLASAPSAAGPGAYNPSSLPEAVSDPWDDHAAPPSPRASMSAEWGGGQVSTGAVGNDPQARLARRVAAARVARPAPGPSGGPGPEAYHTRELHIPPSPQWVQNEFSREFQASLPAGVPHDGGSSIGGVATLHGSAPPQRGGVGGGGGAVQRATLPQTHPPRDPTTNWVHAEFDKAISERMRSAPASRTPRGGARAAARGY